MSPDFAINQEQGIPALQLMLSGQVQGVGFRPFVFQLAHSHRLLGWVRNRIGQVEVHVQGEADELRRFTRALLEQAPPLARPRLDSCTPVAAESLDEFTILDSTAGGGYKVHLPVDMYTCPDCLAELDDPQDRRYRYPFINCTQCGPRYTLIRQLPYDRPNTTMAAFELCDACRHEYEDPHNRRFHAEPVACPACGPQLEFIIGDSHVTGNEPALKACAEAIAAGGIIAVKGIGGYHLLCDARDDHVINRLRASKRRPHKPFAVMFPAPPDRPLAAVRRTTCLSRDQADILLSPQRPVLLLHCNSGSEISERVAPGLDEVGALLPYSPLHHLLLNELGFPVVATSANISGEPVLTDNITVMHRLGDIIDGVLHHNRPIARPADDPVYRVINDRPRPLRLGRGTAPLELELPFTLDKPLIATGGHMKNTVALAWDDRVVISPHIGELGAKRSYSVFENTIADLQSLYRVDAETVVCDAHPGYRSSHWAAQCGLPLQRVWHHHAHASAAWDPGVDGPMLVFAWDGTGLGEDGTLWGGEALLGRPGHWQRVASMRPFHLPGGEQVALEPWRSAAALCWATGNDLPAVPRDTGLLHAAWEKRLNCPQSSAVGRLFDAAAALTGLCTHASFEGQGPMLLETAARDLSEPVTLPLERDGRDLLVTDWSPLVPMLLDTDIDVTRRAGLFHASLSTALVQQALAVRDSMAFNAVGLGGGVFQNSLLVRQCVRKLQAAGFTVHIPDKVPVNDGGLCHGQVIDHGMRTAPAI